MRVRRRSRLVRSAALGLAILTLCAAERANAEGGPRVALVTSDPEGTTARRLDAELRSLGLEVVLVPVATDAPPGRAALEEIARAQGAFAAVRLVGVAASVEVWIADRVTGKTVVREVRATDTEAGARDDTIAVGTVELLRASLLEISVDPQPSHGEVPPPPAARELAALEPPPRAEKPRRSVALALGPVLDFGLGGVGQSALLGLTARWQSAGLFGIEAGFGGAIVGAQLRQSSSGSTGEAEIRLNRLSLGLNLDPVRLRVAPNAGLGFAEVCLESRGRASGDARGRVDTGCTPAGYARGGVALRAGTHLRLRLDAALLLAARPLAIRFVHFDQEQVARWGLPAAEAALSLELMLPR